MRHSKRAAASWLLAKIAADKVAAFLMPVGELCEKFVYERGERVMAFFIGVVSRRRRLYVTVHVANARDDDMCVYAWIL